MTEGLRSPAAATWIEVLERRDLLRRMPWEGPEAPDWAPLVEREWLLTNGLGGYASGTVSGAPTRRYHGWLIGAFPPPVGRVMLLAGCEERVRLPDGRQFRLGGEERPGALELHGARYLSEFRLEAGLPVWTYDFHGVTLERRLLLPHRRNVVCLGWRLLGGADTLELNVAPRLHLRCHDTPVTEPLRPESYRAGWSEGWLRVDGPEGLPSVNLALRGGETYWREDPRVVPALLYQVEASRGYGSVGDLWQPGCFRTTLEPGGGAALVAGAEAPEALPDPLDPRLTGSEIERRLSLLERAGAWAYRSPGAELAVAADAFVIAPPRETRDGEGEARSVIAGYHWFTDWGRDTMISLEGLTLTPRRWRAARQILVTFARHARDGLIPNLFPEGHSEGLYHTADATLWFFHAIDRYAKVTGDRTLVPQLLPTLREIAREHVEGTRFGIGVDADDGLLRQGADGYQLTWMDAKVGDWVVTPRRGKAVEINALWYNALRLLERWEGEQGNGGAAREAGERAERTRASFNRRFWYAPGGYLYDVVDGERGDDHAFRPNQLFAVSLPHPVLEAERWRPVVEAVRDRLLTPVGLRSLAPDHPDYKPTYFGDLRTRDAAYHQGTVWGWLIGPFVDAWLRVHPDGRGEARGFLVGLVDHLAEGCIGSLAEVFDAEAPHHPRGCVAQAWTIAEVLRCWRLTEPG